MISVDTNIKWGLIFCRKIRVTAPDGELLGLQNCLLELRWHPFLQEKTPNIPSSFYFFPCFLGKIGDVFRCVSFRRSPSCPIRNKGWERWPGCVKWDDLDQGTCFPIPSLPWPQEFICLPRKCQYDFGSSVEVQSKSVGIWGSRQPDCGDDHG